MKQLPTEHELREILGLKFGEEIGDLLQKVLLDPVVDFISRPSKKFRARLAHLGYRLAGGLEHEKELLRDCETTMAMVELTHAGSLVVDDIQDGSQMRRGKESLHQLYGLPLALNAGNWLYFWALALLRRTHLSPESELQLIRLFHQNFIGAHCGQALDIGLPMDQLQQSRVRGVCLAAFELKTGLLVSQALVAGALIAGASEADLNAFDHYGRGLGVILQMFNDIGNAKGKVEPEKRWEDLSLRRPSWLWGTASEFPAEKYQEFVTQVGRLPDATGVEEWLSKNHAVAKAEHKALEFLREVRTPFVRHFSGRGAAVDQTLNELLQIEAQITEAYG